MHDQKSVRTKRLSIWFTLNLVVFIVCYLNYRLQLKHRYLYKTLNVGLCLSRAAAMVINFNLLLVWLPMCKYTLTRLACMATDASSRQRHKLQELRSSPLATSSASDSFDHQTTSNELIPMATSAPLKTRLLMKLKLSANRSVWRFQYWFCLAKMNYINSFLVAVDHCTSLHTICATTITLASVIHTVAHLMNVMNFSKNFDPLLGNLNMAEHKGQNPLQLLVSVPGITGCFLMVILLLMSLSSLDSIRNSSFDLFQIFHRLSVVFVVLLIIHPSSHVLKEQSNVDRHHPEICHKEMLIIYDTLGNIRNGNLNGTSSSLSRAIMTTNNTVAMDNSSSTVRSSTIVRRRTTGSELANVSGAAAAVVPVTVAAPASAAAANGAPAGVRPNSAPNSLVRSTSQRTFPTPTGDSIEFSGTADGGSINSGQPATINIGRSHDRRAVHDNNRLARRHVDNNDDYDIESENVKSATSTTTTTLYDLKQTNPKNTLTNSTSQPKSKQIKVNETIRLPTLNNNDTNKNDLITENNSWNLFNYVQKNNRAANETPILSSKQRTKDDTKHDDDGSAGATHGSNNKPCPDARPLFVAQSSILWYVLSAGLSCYLLDLILRRLRRSKSTIQLLDVRSDCEGNLIELILSNNHRRFAHWLPGQFVYLNCPQIAAYEWHPFTISTMDNRTRQFTLHIKTGGDWTRKLRHELELRRRQSSQVCSMSLSSHYNQGYTVTHGSGHGRNIIKSNSITTTIGETIQPSHVQLSTAQISWIGQRTQAYQSPLPPVPPSPPTSAINDIHCQITNVDCYDYKTGQLQIECKKITHLNSNDDNNMDESVRESSNGRCCPVTNNVNYDIHHLDHLSEQEHCVVCSSRLTKHQMDRIILRNDCNQHRNSSTSSELKLKSLELYIDGPFHSPFERLLEQQVSVCIANGVGWTAFSSVFQRITNNLARLEREANQESWWSQWQDYAFEGGINSALKSFDARCYEGDVQQSASKSIGKRIECRPSEVVTSQKTSTRAIRSNDSSLHLLVIVTTIEQLRPFYVIARRYFQLIQREFETNHMAGPHPVKEVKAFITRSTHHDADVIEFCRKENLQISSSEGDGSLGGNFEQQQQQHDDNHQPTTMVVRVNETFSIHFGKPDFGEYLGAFRTSYADKRKISVYCCGSYQVKRSVERICRHLNRSGPRSLMKSSPHEVHLSRQEGDNKQHQKQQPKYCYHEENF